MHFLYLEMMSLFDDPLYPLMSPFGEPPSPLHVGDFIFERPLIHDLTSKLNLYLISSQWKIMMIGQFHLILLHFHNLLLVQIR